MSTKVGERSQCHKMKLKELNLPSSADYHWSIAVKRYRDEGNTYEREYLTRGLLTVSEGY